MNIPPPAKKDLARKKIVYSVPYVAMQDKNDCWLAALRMMREFLAPLNPGYELKGTNAVSQQNGAEDKQLATLMATNGFKALPGGKDAFKSPAHLFTALDAHGPIVACIQVSGVMQHAVVVAGVNDHENVYLLNPANNFASATLRDEVSFKDRERVLLKELGDGSESFEKWRARQPEPRPGGGGSSPQRSPSMSPLHSPGSSPKLGRQHASWGKTEIPLPSSSKTPPDSPGRVSPSRSRSDSDDEENRAALLSQVRLSLMTGPPGQQDQERQLETAYLEEKQTHLHERKKLAFDQFVLKLTEVPLLWVAG